MHVQAGLLTLCGAAWATDTSPAPELSPTEELQSFSLAPGFRIELVAAEPLIEDPVAITWDEDGRLYAAEMRGFMPDAFGAGQDAPNGTVVRLTDTDADLETLGHIFGRRHANDTALRQQWLFSLGRTLHRTRYWNGC